MSATKPNQTPQTSQVQVSAKAEPKKTSYRFYWEDYDKKFKGYYLF